MGCRLAGQSEYRAPQPYVLSPCRSGYVRRHRMDTGESRSGSLPAMGQQIWNGGFALTFHFPFRHHHLRFPRGIQQQTIGIVDCFARRMVHGNT